MAGDTTTRTRPRGSLTREEIIKEALALLEEHGPGALSMRRLAERLGVAPNALYTHVHGKADLIDGLIDQVYAGLDLDPDPAGDWTQQLATLSQAVRAHLLAHPAVVPYARQQPGLGPHSLRLGEAIYRVLRPAGFSDQAADQGRAEVVDPADHGGCQGAADDEGDEAGGPQQPGLGVEAVLVLHEDHPLSGRILSDVLDTVH